MLRNHHSQPTRNSQTVCPRILRPAELLTDKLTNPDRRYALRNSNLSFADLAIEIGKQWRTISEAEEAFYKSQALAAKEAFRRDSKAYTETKEYREYQEYLKAWKKRERERIQSMHIHLCFSFAGFYLTDLIWDSN